MSADKHITRRNFMSIVTWAIGGLIGVGLGIPGIAYILGPAKKSDEDQDWIRLGLTSKVELNTPTLFKTSITKQTGWISNEEEISVYVLTKNGRDYVAMTNICTHLGCRVRWISEKEQFFCPCHTAVFDKNGDVVSGPPPRPLDRYKVKIEDDQLYILGG
ncbi:MAG: ubiquinol-cytochrome c reductase iron-sulfur subunit [Anaerolineales bacterium]|nr:ubiquinol-cytochrome c reductase iron-sulfur subunit [Anaerolineales bacterium]